MKTSKVFALVKADIKNNRWNYICSSIKRLHDTNKITKEKKNYCIHIIEQALEGNCTYTLWLESRHPTFFRKNNCAFSSTKQGRIQWLNALIAYYKKQGD